MGNEARRAKPPMIEPANTTASTISKRPRPHAGGQLRPITEIGADFRFYSEERNESAHSEFFCSRAD
jgi:hypothetical protein